MRPAPLRVGRGAGARVDARVGFLLAVGLGLSLAALPVRADAARANEPGKPGEPRRPPPVVGAAAGAEPPAAPDRGVVGGRGAAPAPPEALRSEDGGGDYGYAGDSPEAATAPPAVGAAPRGPGGLDRLGGPGGGERFRSD